MTKWSVLNVGQSADENSPSLSERAHAQRVGEEFGEAGPREAGRVPAR